MTDAAPPPPILPEPPAADASASTLRRDLISAYLASGAKIGSWVVLSSLVYRYVGREEFAIFAFVRGTLGILNYLAFGLGPAMVRLIAEAKSQKRPQPISDPVLAYATPEPPRPEVTVYASGTILGMVCVCAGAGVVFGYAHFFPSFTAIATVGWNEHMFVVLLGIGLVIRLASDIPGAVLQTHGAIAIDNVLVAAAELLWVVLIFCTPMPAVRSLRTYGETFLDASVALVLARLVFAATHLGLPRFRFASDENLKRLATFGAMVVVAQLADFLYAPTDYLLINGFVRPAASAIADYAPAVQIDSGLLVVVAGMASVLLPRAALAHVAGDVGRVRKYYLLGTAASATVLAAAALLLLIVKERLFVLWFHTGMPGTQAILPLVLIHTVIGGSSAVGRSILLGMGKVKPFTIAVLISGVSNVLLSYVFVRYFHLGLRGIIYGTIIAVIGRCAIWMPWYVLRSLRQNSHPAERLPG